MISLQAKIGFLSVLFLSLFVVTFGLGSKPLWDYDEATYAEVTHEMRTTKDFVTLQFGYEPFLEKPPLFIWASFVSSSVFGESEFSFRLPSALSFVALVAVCMALVFEVTASTSASILIGLLLVSLSPLIEPARQMRIDSMVVLWIVLSVYALIRGFRQKQWLALYGISVGLTVLTKSVIGVFAVFALPLYIYWFRSFWIVKNKYFWWGIVGGLLICLPWHAYELFRFGHTFWVQYVLYTVSQRFQQDLFNMHAPSNKDYLWFLVNFAAPWIQVFILSLVPLALYWKNIPQKVRAGIGVSCALLFSVMVVFFCAATKAPTYLLPMYPFLAIALTLSIYALYTKLSSKWRIVCVSATLLLIAIGFSLSIYNGFHINPYYGAPDALAKEERVVGYALRNQTKTLYAFQGYRELGSIIYYSKQTHVVSLTENQTLVPGDDIVLYKTQKESFFKEHPDVSTISLFTGTQIELLQVTSEN